MIAGAVAVMWLRQDRPGNDACRFALIDDELLIEGSTSETAGQFLHYRVRAAADGVTRRARIGDVPMLTFEHEGDGRWMMNGIEVPEVRGALDFDLGVTPATNTLAIRRMNLAVGDSAEAVAAWLDPSDWMLKPLKQRYTRVSETEYDYASDTGFSARLTVDEHGIVRDYPGWWKAQD
ncbi:MAG: hypothetical protein GC146_09400 [Limimaricola sp.]|uniref:putative glycolipid-binding domain-containing protein n=1 Tax=Limimaricola sp. TaxID=2211665 RepID=UPI001D6039B1|nr:putative glycolipid-binding domain-containing protein [Limimaricola sp.]MBI1417425.1 hypothetical protein [Limimaricola sp.]